MQKSKRQITVHSLNKKLAEQTSRERRLSALKNAVDGCASGLTAMLTPVIIEILNEEAKEFPFMFTRYLIQKKLRERGIVCTSSFLWDALGNFNTIPNPHISSPRLEDRFADMILKGPIIVPVKHHYYEFVYERRVEFQSEAKFPKKEKK